MHMFGLVIIGPGAGWSHNQENCFEFLNRPEGLSCQEKPAEAGSLRQDDESNTCGMVWNLVWADESASKIQLM